ncbi:MAG: TrkA C-terminal domain-containing protein [Bacillota bacterium]
MKREPTGKARYEGIAQDLARRIAANDLPEGTRLLGRSSLAGTYQVSPETIRRAVAILHERGVVQAVAGSGIRVISRVAAQEYLDSIRTQSKLEEGARELRSLLRQRRELDEQIETALDRLLSQAAGALATRHVEEIVISESSWTVGRSLGEIRLRSSTGATAVALTRGESDHFSPPPDMLLAAGDVLTVVGSDAARTRARELLAAEVPPGEPRS